MADILQELAVRSLGKEDTAKIFKELTETENFTQMYNFTLAEEGAHAQAHTNDATPATQPTNPQ